MIVIVGESASGKSSVAKFIKWNYGYKRIITYTTRQPRHNEKDGLDYYFLTDDEFEEKKNNGFFAETAEYNGWKYGSAKKDYCDNVVAVLTPKGLRSLKRNGIDNIFSVYLKVPRRDRLKKCLERGDNIEEAYRRSLSDVGQFDGIEDEVDCIVDNAEYHMGIQEVAEEIISRYRHERI